MLFPFRNTRKKSPLFVLGSQRSGTTMVADTFAKSPDCEVFLGDKRRLVFQGASRLVPVEIVEKLVARTRKRVSVFKPNNDLQYANAFLDFHPNTRILWVYRDYRDVINSSLKRWGNAHGDIMNGICQGCIMHPGQKAIAEGIREDLLASLQCLRNVELTAEDGAALLWYVRNSLYFDLHLDKSPRVLLINYEQSVKNPSEHFKRMFEFAGVKFKPAYVGDIFDASIGKESSPTLGKEIESRCQSMMAQLDAQYQAGTLHGHA